MSTNIEALKVYASVGVDLSDLRKGIKDADAELSKVGAGAKANGLDKLVGEISGKLKSIGAGLTSAGLGLTAAFTAPVALAVNAASDLNESLNKVQVVFGQSAGKIQEFAKTSSASLGISQQKALEAAGTFGNLFTAMKIGQPAAAEMSISLTKLAADLGSFNNLEPTEVLEKLRAGITGEAEPLKALGILINETAVKSKAMELGFKEVNGQLTEQAKVAARYALIMEQSKTAQGDFANTSTGLANSTRILKAEFETLAANLGQAFLPYVNKAVVFINGLVQKFQQLPEPVKQAITVVAGIGAVLGPVLVVVGTLVSAIGAALPVITAIGGALAALSAPVLAVIAIVVALAAAYATNFGGIRDTVNEAVANLKPLFEDLVAIGKQVWEGLKVAFEALRPLFEGIVKNIALQLSAVIDVIRAILRAIQGDWSGAWELLKSATQKATQGILAVIKGLGEILLNILVGIWKLMVAGAEAAWNGLLSLLSGIWNGIKSAAISIWTGLLNFFTQTIPHALGIVVSFFASLPAKILGFIKQIPEGVAYALGFLAGTGARLVGEFVTTVINFFAQLPQRVVTYASQIWEFVKTAFSTGITFVSEVVSTGFDAIVGFFASLPSRALAFITSLWEFIKSAFSAGVQFAIGAATNLFNGVVQWIGQLPTKITEIFNNIFSFFTSLPGILLDKAIAIGKAVWEGFKKGLGIASPSGPEKDVAKMDTGLQMLLQDVSNNVAAPAQKAGKSIRQNFAAGFSGLDAEIEKTINLMATAPEKVEKVVAPGFKKAAQGIKESFKEILDAVNEFQDTLGTGVKLTERELVDLVKTFGRALPDAALEYKRTREELQKEVVRLNEVFRKNNQDMKAVFKDGRVIIEQGGKEFADELKKNKEAVARVASLNDVFAKSNSQLVAILNERNRIVIRSTEQLRAETSQVAQKLSDDLSKKLGEDLKKELAVEGEKVRETYISIWRRTAEEAGLTASQSVEFIVAELKKLPPSIREVVKPGVDAYIEELRRAGKFTEEETARMGGSFSDFFNKLKDTLGTGMAELITGVLQSLGKLNTETIKRFGEVSSGILDIVGALPGKVGDKLRAVTSTFLDWVNRIDTILKGLHKIFNSIPDGLGELAAKIIDIFKKSSKQVLDTSKATQDEIQKAAKKASQETDGLAGSAEEGSSRISKAFGIATSAVGAFVSGLATANATGSKAIGSLVGGLQGALSGFAAGGPIGAVIGGIGGVLGGLFGGKSAAQKQQEKLELERLKQDVQKGAQEVMQAAFDTMQRALETFEKLADFTKVPRRLIDKFFQQMRVVIQHFIALAKVWSVQMIDAAKKFAESIGPILETIAAGVEAFEKLSFFTGVPEKAIALFGEALERAIALFIELSDSFQNKAEKQARKFARRALDVVATIGQGVEAFLKLNEYKGISVEVFDLFKRDLEYALEKMIEVADDINLRLLKQAARFSERALAVVVVIKEGVDAFKGLNEYKAISPEIFDAFLADLKLAVVKMQQVVEQIDTEMLSMASAFSQKSLAIFAAIKAGVEAFTALREYKALPAEVLNQFLEDFKGAIALLKDTLALALEGEELAAKFQEAVSKIADYLAKAGQTLAGIGSGAAQAAQTAVVAGAAASVIATSAASGAASTYTPSASYTTHTTRISYGGSTAHIQEGDIYLRVDASEIEEVQNLIRIMQEARQKHRARRIR